MAFSTGPYNIPPTALLSNVHQIKELVNHKLYILEQSIKSMEHNLDDMCFQSMVKAQTVAAQPSSHNPSQSDATNLCAIKHSTFLCDTDRCQTCLNYTKIFAKPKRSLDSSQGGLVNQLYSIHNVNTDILASSGVIISGGDNELLCSILSSASVWTKLENIVEELSTLLCFVIQSHVCEKTSVILDARGTDRLQLKAFMESLHTTQRKTGNSIDIARVLIDRPTQTGTIVKSIRSTRSLPVDILTSDKSLRRYTTKDNLPTQLGGKQHFNKYDFIRFHREVDASICASTQSINGVLHASHTLSRTPTTMQHCTEAISQHKATISSLSSAQDALVTAISRHQLATVQHTQTLPKQTLHKPRRSKSFAHTSTTGGATARSGSLRQLNYPVPAQRPVLSKLLLENEETGETLKLLETYTKGAEIYCSIMEKLNTLTILTASVSKLKSLAEERLAKLYGYEKLWSNIEEITQTLTLLKRAHELINGYRSLSCNLRAARQNLEKFATTEPPVTSLLEHGKALLENVQKVLDDTKVPIPWLQQLCTKLHTELCFISSLLHKTKTSVTRTYDCYVKLDQAYDWAQDAMKFISQDPMENPMTYEALELLATGLKSFMEQKTLIDDVVFDEISREARFLSNRKLSEQCKTAKRRCSETRHLAKVRLERLAKRQQEVASTDCSPITDHQTSQHSSALETCRMEYRVHSSQSAPATPALSAKCNNHTDLNRRSQSLEDDIASEILQRIAADSSNSTQLMSISTNTAICHDSELDTTEVGVLEQTNIEEVKVTVHEVFEEKATENEVVVLPTEADNNERDIVDVSLDSVSEVECHTVYRGDKFIEQADVTIPFDEDIHLNNNTLFIQSPTIEDGHIVFAPANKSLQKEENVLDLDDCHIDKNSQPSSRSSSLNEETHNVTFDIMAAETSGEDDEETIQQTNTLLEPVLENKIQSRLSPILSQKQKQKAMQKRRSFHGFTSALTMPLLNFARSWKATEENAKRHSVSEEPEQMENNSTLAGKLGSPTQPGGTDCSLKDKDASRLLKVKRMDKTMSLITSSTDSLPSLPEDDVMDSNTLPRIGRYRHSDQGWTPVPVNSHLINRRVLPSQRCSSMADLRLTESEIKSRITLAHIIDELVQTERDYVISLRLVVDSYIPELGRDDVPQTLRGKRAVIFGNIEKIYEFHNRYFLEDITKCENEPFKIGHFFLKHQSSFLMYALYNKNKPKSDALMQEYGSSFFKEQQMLMGDKMDLSSYLLKPVQRMGKYALILKQVLKECSETTPEYQELVSAEEMVRFCLQHGNDLLAMDSLQECDVNLQEQGTLMLQDEFTVYKNRRKVVRHLFLFEHLLIMAKTKRIGAGRDQYVYKTSLKTADIGLTENVGEGGVKFGIWFRKRTGENWTMHARSSQVKNRWVNAIEKLLWDQALKNRESKQTELSTMDVGHKPSLDLKKSADNIHDRFIPTLSKPIGKRHSMDSLNLSDTFEETKKRPYSIISLATSSSSNSSSGSTGPGSRVKPSHPWLDLKAIITGKDSVRHQNLRKMYKSESRIHRCDSGISSSSDAGLATKFYPSNDMLNNIVVKRKDSGTEV